MTRSKELLLFIFFLAVSAAFWAMQTLDEVLDKKVDVRVTLEGVPEGVVITSSLPDVVTLTVRDKGTNLLHYVRHELPPLTLHFADYAGTQSGRVQLTGQEVGKLLQTNILPTSRIVALDPDTLEFWFNQGAKRTLPVVVTGSIETTAETYVRSVETEPSEVTVYAPAAILDTLTAIYTQPLCLKDLSQDTRLTARLQNIKGAKLTENDVEVSIAVDFYVEKEIRVPIKASNFPAGKTLKTFPSEAVVTCTVGYIQSQDINADDIPIVITYEQILAIEAAGKERIRLELRSKPEGVTNVKIEPQEVDFLVEAHNDSD